MGHDIPGYAYAAIVAIGGIVGYTKAGSIPSLGAGLIFGGMLGYGAYKSSKNICDCEILLGGSSVLCALMAYRFYQSQKLMPAGLMATVSAAAMVHYGYRYYQICRKVDLQ